MTTGYLVKKKKKRKKEKHVLLQQCYLGSISSQFVCHWSRMMSSTQKPRPPPHIARCLMHTHSIQKRTFHCSGVHIVIVLIFHTDEVKRVEQYEDKLPECHKLMDITGFLKCNPYIKGDHR